jgi:sigma-B regulation protein RsbU (phosphoserine phosphatase)
MCKEMQETQTRFTVLAVDDTPENLDVVKGILAPKYIVKVALNGPTALKIVEKQPPDLILLDIMMHGMDGYEVCRRLKADPETSDIPIIFLTAMDQTTDEAFGFDLGAADYITKPVNPPILEARVKTLLALKRSMDELHKAYSIIKSQRDRMEEELNIGHNIQMSMVPLQFPAFPDRDEFDVYALLKPAREVGGDFYDFFLINHDELCLVVGDVSGKGVPAALFMAVTRTMIKTCATDNNSPASIIARVNEALSVDNPECMFVTLFLGICNVNSGEFVYTNAGHNRPFIKRADGRIECIDQLHGPIAGAVGSISYKQDKLSLRKGDLIFMFTDGVSEAMDSGSNLYGDQRIVGYLEGLDGNDTRIAVDGIAASLEKFAGEARQSDDITVLAMRFDQETEPAAFARFDLNITNKMSEISRVIEAFKSFAEKSRISMSITMKLNLVFDDLLNNIVSYAFPEGGNHEIKIHAEKSGDRILLTVEDDGIPFNPFAQTEADTSLSLEDRKIGGLGIHLIKNIMDEVSYKRRIDHNVVTLIKELEGATPIQRTV